MVYVCISPRFRSKTRQHKYRLIYTHTHTHTHIRIHIHTLHRFPKHFAMGTVVDGPADYYSGRMDKAQRKKSTLTDQLLADTDVSNVSTILCAVYASAN